MKFYRAGAGAKQKVISKLNKKLEELGPKQATSDADVNCASQMQMVEQMEKELEETRLYRFSVGIDTHNKNAFIK